MPCFSPLKGFRDEETGGIVFKDSYGAKSKMEVACGQCLGCRIDRSRTWAMRIVHESSLHEYAAGNSFVTLTYRSKEESTKDQLANGYYVPDDFSLHKEHVQKFLKRLRKAYTGQKIRYYYCGEYGSICSHGLDVDVYRHAECQTGRPHYHLCLFNYTPRYANPVADTLFNCAELDELWKYGFTTWGELNFQSAAYVSRYCLKKVNGLAQDDHYRRITDDGEIIFLEPEYASMSRRPGIGKDWYEQYKNDVFPSSEVPIPGVGVVKSVPRYYDEQLKMADPVLYESIKRRRKKYVRDNPDDFCPQRLKSKYIIAKAKQKLKTETL